MFFVSMSSELLQIKKNENVRLTGNGDQGEGWTKEKGPHQLIERGGGGMTSLRTLMTRAGSGSVSPL
jgi:hypothetical protein